MDDVEPVSVHSFTEWLPPAARMRPTRFAGPRMDHRKDPSPMSFSLELSDDVIQVRDWVHDFAEQVVRPAAARCLTTG